LQFTLKCGAPILTPVEIERFEAKMARQIAQVDDRAGYAGQLGWIDVRRCVDDGMLRDIRRTAEDIRSFADVFAVVGIGGSNQGARAVIEALPARETGSPKVIYPALSLSAEAFRRAMAETDGKSLAVDVIAKDFKTLEPGVVFQLLRDLMAARYGKEDIRRRIIVTPTPGLDALHAIAVRNAFRVFPFPEDVGGRYSVFTPVGLLPMAVAGVDIGRLLDGAADAQKSVERGGKHRRMALDYALSRNLLYQKGYDVEVMASFEPSCSALGKWWRQLFGESEGKDLRGIYPTVAQYTEDLHSLGQFMQSGKRHIMETFLHLRSKVSDVSIGKGDGNEDGLDYLAGKTLNKLNEAAYEATVTAHSEGGVPCQIFEIEQADEYHLGEWMYTMMVSCYYSSVFLGVNPFDQPGVEAYKAEMFKRLKR
jgi:glucose-6-phosphate isomerase